LAEYRDHAAELRQLGVDIAAVSVDPPERSAALRAELALPFTLLGDTRREVVERWGVFNRAEKGGIAYPAVFVIDRDRTVRYRSLDRMRSRVSVDGIVAFLRAGMDSAAPAVPVRSRVRPGIGGFYRALVNVLRMGIRSPRS
jgi:peroxiredoxin